MSAHNPLSNNVISDEPVFLHEGSDIFLRCVDDCGDHMGDLRIARAEIPAHAATLVNAANAGIQVMRGATLDRDLRQWLDESTGGDGAGDGKCGGEA